MPCMSVLTLLHALPDSSCRAAFTSRAHNRLCRDAPVGPWAHGHNGHRLRCVVALASPASPERLELGAAILEQNGRAAALESFVKLAELLCIAAAGGLQVAVVLVHLRAAPAGEREEAAEGRRHSRAEERTHTRLAHWCGVLRCSSRCNV